MIDASKVAVSAFEDKVPWSVMGLLVAVAAIASGVAGYCDGVSERRLVLVLAVQPLLVALVIVTIADMDQPFQGLVRVSRKALERAQETVQ